MSVEPKRILVRGVNWLGDAVMTTPAMFRLRERFPQAHITLLTPEKLAGLWEKQSWLNEVITFGAEDSLWKVAKKLRGQGFDLGVVLPNSTRSALELWLGGVGNRTGYGGRARSFLLNQVVERTPGLVAMRKRTVAEIHRLVAGEADTAPKPGFKDHQLHHYLHLVAAVGASAEPLIPTIETDSAERMAIWAKFGLPADGRPVFGVNPGAEYGPAKRWPAENFMQVAGLVNQRVAGHWLVFGGKGDVVLAEQVASGIKAQIGTSGMGQAQSLAGRTSLRELAVILSGCQTVLTNDTGPMHLAAGVRTNLVAVFGSTSPELTGPGLPGEGKVSIIRGKAPCQPCFLRECPIDRRCLTSIPVKLVAQEILKNLELPA
jgi:heptosyltransferase-2